MGYPGPFGGDIELIKLVMRAQQAKLSHSVEQANKTGLQAGLELAPKIINIVEPLGVGLLHDLLGKVARQCSTPGKANDINGQAFLWRLPQDFIEQMLPLGFYNSMGAPGGQGIPVQIRSVARTTLVVG